MDWRSVCRRRGARRGQGGRRSAAGRGGRRRGARRGRRFGVIVRDRPAAAAEVHGA